jgi:hypothetical protein
MIGYAPRKSEFFLKICNKRKADMAPHDLAARSRTGDVS